MATATMEVVNMKTITGKVTTTTVRPKVAYIKLSTDEGIKNLVIFRSKANAYSLAKSLPTDSTATATGLEQTEIFRGQERDQFIVDTLFSGDNSTTTTTDSSSTSTNEDELASPPACENVLKWRSGLKGMLADNPLEDFLDIGFTVESERNDSILGKITYLTPPPGSEYEKSASKWWYQHKWGHGSITMEF